MNALLTCADRVVGAHFFSPAHVMPLLEIVRTDRTSKQARAGSGRPCYCVSFRSCVQLGIVCISCSQ